MTGRPWEQRLILESTIRSHENTGSTSSQEGEHGFGEQVWRTGFPVTGGFQKSLDGYGGQQVNLNSLHDRPIQKISWKPR